MIRTLTVGAVLVGLLAAGTALAQTTVGTVRLGRTVLADGKPLAAGAYHVRLTGERPTPAAGQSAHGEQWIEFVKNGTVAGRELATVLTADEVGQVAKGPAPRANGSRVDLLKGGEYARVWVNHEATSYIINMPVVGEERP